MACSSKFAIVCLSLVLACVGADRCRAHSAIVTLSAGYTAVDAAARLATVRRGQGTVAPAIVGVPDSGDGGSAVPQAALRSPDALLYAVLALLLTIATAIVLGLWRRRFSRHPAHRSVAPAICIDELPLRAAPSEPAPSPLPADADAAAASRSAALFAHLSHEARTSFLRVAPRPPASGEAHAPGHDLALVRSVRRLQRLFDQALDLGMFVAPGPRPEFRTHDLAALVEAVRREMVPYAGKREIRLEAATQPLPWTFDADLVEKVLANLLSNAIKFSADAGTIAIVVDAGRDAVEIGIEDSGGRLEADVIARAFDPLDRALHVPAHGKSGAGLGLAVSRRIAELHGGALEARLGEGGGKRFCLSLPRREGPLTEAVPHAFGRIASLEAEAVLSVPEPARPTDRPRVLVADDRADGRSQCGAMLAGTFVVDTGGLESLAHVRRTLPDLVVLDLSAWSDIGLAALQPIREDPDAGDIPIIVVAPAGADCDRGQALRAGADELLVAPVDGRTLLARACALVDERLRLRQSTRARAIHERPAEVRKHVFLEHVRSAISAHLHDEAFSVEQLADRLHTSRYQLFRRVKQLTGCSPQELIMQARLERAATLLARHAGTVSEVAYTVGYGSLPHFSRSFRRRYGVPPSGYAAGHADTPPRGGAAPPVPRPRTDQGTQAGKPGSTR